MGKPLPIPPLPSDGQWPKAWERSLAWEITEAVLLLSPLAIGVGFLLALVLGWF